MHQRWHGFVVAVTAAAGLWHPARAPWREKFATGLFGVDAAHDSFIVVGTLTERDAVAVMRPTFRVQVLQYWFWDVMNWSDPSREQIASLFDHLVGGLAANSSRLVLSVSAEIGLFTSELPVLRWLGTEYLTTHFVRTPIDAEDFHGVVVTRKTEGR